METGDQILFGNENQKTCTFNSQVSCSMHLSHSPELFIENKWKKKKPDPEFILKWKIASLVLN